MKLDLHIHTTASDGAWPPDKVVEAASRGGLFVVAQKDHDTTAAVSVGQARGVELDVQVIPAIEMSSTHDNREVHVLGYFLDLEFPDLQAYTARASDRRRERMQEMVRRLQHDGVEVSFHEVEKAAGPDRVNIGRPHLARVLVSRGYASSIIDAFASFIGDRHPAFVPTALLSPGEAVELISAAGGIPMWAHPPGDLVEVLLPGMLERGLRGLEVYRPSSSRNDVLRLERICRRANLLVSGGSDWHSPESGNTLGDFHVTADEVDGLLEEGGL
ncbi:MAG: PHP domain-containing protein [Gemmatimonadota bacterium]